MNQTDTILIALTRTDVPRTVENISVETGIPRASVRRILGQLRRKSAVASFNLGDTRLHALLGRAA